MKVDDFAYQYLGLKNARVLEVYQGYLITGRYKKEPRCIWINKQNIEGLTEVMKVLAIETAFRGILSFIPGGSFAYQLIKDQIGYPPRYNVIFEPNMYEITYSLIALDHKGKPQNIIDSLAQNVDSVAKTAFKTGEKIHESLKELITHKKTKDSSQSTVNEELPLGFTYIRFYDKVSLVRNQIIGERIEKTASRKGKISKNIVAELAPSIIISFKTTANEEAIVFLKNLQSIGFQVRFSQTLGKTDET